jgi:hypothetical protein
MDVVWLIVDSLSFSATPFAAAGPPTMPKLKSLADDHAAVFTNAYAPGPSSPSSHGSFLTGKLPSETGMHEAYPFFDGNVPTIAERLDSLRSFMISANPFIFNGLYRGFDEWDDLKVLGDPPFEDATDPAAFNHVEHDSPVEKYREFLFAGGKPIRSLLNGLAYRWRRRQQTEEATHYAEIINRRIERFLEADDRDAFVVANYMEVHPPLDASDEALARFASDWTRAELPVGAKGSTIQERIQSEPGYEGDDMYALYKAAIWDIDRTIAPLVKRLVEDGTMVVVTADHGNWFRRRHDLDEERIHVPLLIFAPDGEPRRIFETVNIRSLPRTTMEIVCGESGGFDGRSLLDIETDEVSITEFIHEASDDATPVTPSGEMSAEGSVIYQIAAVKGGARVDHDGEDFIVRRDTDPVTAELREVIDGLRARNVDTGTRAIDYDADTIQRLENLGYME